MHRRYLAPIFLWILLILALLIASGENIKPKPYLIDQEINQGVVHAGDSVIVTLNVSGTVKNFITDSERINIRNTGTLLLAYIDTHKCTGPIQNIVYVTADKDYRFLIKMQVEP
jgi:hypothetical protein